MTMPRFAVKDVCIYQSGVKERFGSGEGRNCRITKVLESNKWADPETPEYEVEFFLKDVFQPPGPVETAKALETDLEPLVVHGLHHGLPLCLFTRDVPGDWPIGHIWVPEGFDKHINCPLCKERVGKVGDGWV